MDADEQVVAWRVKQLTALRFSVPQAEDLARRLVSWHDAADELERRHGDHDIAYNELREW
jgi:hypothetical protein